MQLELYHTPGKLREKSSVLSSRLKAGRVVDEMTSTGRVFQTRAAMTGKARSPTVDSRDVGTAKVSEDHDRNRCLDGIFLQAFSAERPVCAVFRLGNK